MSDRRQLSDLVSVGQATLNDLRRLGVTSVAELAQCDPQALYEALYRLDGVWHDICVRDTFEAAVAQARNPDLPAEQRQWWYWSRQRKAKARQDAIHPGATAPHEAP